MLDFLAGLRWQTAGLKKRALVNVEGAVVEALGRESSIAFDLLARGPDAADGSIERDQIWQEFTDRWTQSRSIADREDFLHWEVAFPGVWRNWQSFRPEGGFDAVIGNPPWDRIEQLQEVEWFATSRPRHRPKPPPPPPATAAIKQLRDQVSASVPSVIPAPSPLSPGGRAVGVRGIPPPPSSPPTTPPRDRADSPARKFDPRLRPIAIRLLERRSDINLYSLFVERAMSLVKPEGFVGLLTPSGIYADKTAARASSRPSPPAGASAAYARLRESSPRNRTTPILSRRRHPRVVQVLRPRLSAAPSARSTRPRCGFFLPRHRDHRRPRPLLPALTPEDFARVNPNTGTAPVFRSPAATPRSPAASTRSHPVLVDRSKRQRAPRHGRCKLHPRNMFHMAIRLSTSFTLLSSLEDQRDSIRSQGNQLEARRMRRIVPLYEGTDGPGSSTIEPQTLGTDQTRENPVSAWIRAKRRPLA